jgi:ABC-2 type transport system permease protein
MNGKDFLFCNKEFYHIFFGTNARCSSFGMPIAQIMFGFAITNEINNVNIAILDKSKDTETK